MMTYRTPRRLRATRWTRTARRPAVEPLEGRAAPSPLMMAPSPIARVATPVAMVGIVVTSGSTEQAGD